MFVAISASNTTPYFLIRSIAATKLRSKLNPPQIRVSFFQFECRLMIPNLSRMDGFWWRSVSFLHVGHKFTDLVALLVRNSTDSQYLFLTVTIFGFIPLMDHFTGFFSLSTVQNWTTDHHHHHHPDQKNDIRRASIAEHKSCVQHLEIWLARRLHWKRE